MKLPDGGYTNITVTGADSGTGPEDNVLYRKGGPVSGDAPLVERTVRIVRELTLAPATPDEARALLGVTRQN